MNKYKQLGLTLTVMLITFYGTMVVGNYATCRDIKANLPPIYDILHDNDYVVSVLAVDIMLGISNICLSLFIFYLLRYNFKKAILLLNNINLLYGLRIITIFATAFPNSKKCETYCTEDYFTTIRTDFCGDIMFSGHTSTVFIFILYLTQEFNKLYLKIPLYTFQTLYSLAIILSRIHYTDDVIIALALTYMSFKLHRPV
jgi:membrane-associated phospholipid phosphatase